MIKVADYILILCIFCISLFLFPYLQNYFSSDGEKLKVTIDGEVYGYYDINKNQDIIIDEDGIYNKISIRNGVINMIDANCNDRLCVYNAPIEKSYQSIVCLPNKVILEIDEGESEKNDNDFQLDGIAN